MAYIIKNTSGLLNTRLTDAGRMKLSQGKLDIKYFQIGDSEVCYNGVTNYNQTNNYILEAAYNAQNTSPGQQTNKMHIKYPYYVNGTSGSTYGLATEDSQIFSIYNTAAPRGFFTGTPYSWSAQTSSAYTVNSNYIIDVCNLCATDLIPIIYDYCAPSSGTPSVGDYVTILYDGVGGCGNITGNFPILTYRIEGILGTTLQLDRYVPNFSGMSCCGNARLLIYPPSMFSLYDTSTPQSYWPTDVINFESICYLGNTDVKVWNMNIPWSVNPAGLIPGLNEGYEGFGSIEYLGSKEYFGYQEISGQTFWINSTNTSASTDTFYYNSFDDRIDVQPYEQKAIAIVHYTNNAVDSFYGEKFALEPYDINAQDTTGFARNFKVTIPWLMWHKSNTGLMSETFYVDPTGYTQSLFDIKYMKSAINTDMNNPGLRYYHLWDEHPNTNGLPSRVGKVFPDLKTIIFDDEEIVAALSYKSNRNWTLPAPSLSLVTPNVCDINNNDLGVLSADTEYMYVTYRFNASGFTNSLHCNYYTKIQGPKPDCNLNTQNVAIRFGNEFPFMNNCCFQGFNATEFEVLAQKVTGSTTQPNPGQWRVIDFTSQLTANTINGCILTSGLTGGTFVITNDEYVNAPLPYYNLADYISLPLPTETYRLNFGDEYYFYGNIETGIQATIYEMKFLCNLASTQFNNSSNPTWTLGTTSYVTEVGLFDDNKDLVVITKLQSPIIRQGTQQYAVRYDF
jgi:hypothetical protein